MALSLVDGDALGETLPADSLGVAVAEVFRTSADGLSGSDVQPESSMLASSRGRVTLPAVFIQT